MFTTWFNAPINFFIWDDSDGSYKASNDWKAVTHNMQIQHADNNKKKGTNEKVQCYVYLIAYWCLGIHFGIISKFKFFICNDSNESSEASFSEDLLKIYNRTPQSVTNLSWEVNCFLTG